MRDGLHLMERQVQTHFPLVSRKEISALIIIKQYDKWLQDDAVSTKHYLLSFREITGRCHQTADVIFAFALGDVSARCFGHGVQHRVLRIPLFGEEVDTVAYNGKCLAVKVGGIVWTWREIHLVGV